MHEPMARFNSQRDPKEYLISRIVAEAKQEGVPLSDVERKMLYFSETDWTLPGILEVNAEFERDYDETEYEEKIADLVRNLESRATPEEQDMFDDALLKLSDGDHYLQILIGNASVRSEHSALGKLAPWLPAIDAPAKRRPGDMRRLILVGLGFGALFLIAIVITALVR